MKSKIFKYPLENGGEVGELVGGQTDVRVPKNAELLSVKAQYNQPVAYFLITEDPETEGLYEERSFYLAPTGQDFDLKRGMLFYDTLLMYEGGYVLHVFTR